MKIEAKQEAKAEPKANQLFPVVLSKNYVPRGMFEIVGYLKPAVERKDSAGKMLVVEPEAFVEGEMKPAPHPGVGFVNKIWAGTHVKLPLEEAKALVNKKLAERADAFTS